MRLRLTPSFRPFTLAVLALLALLVAFGGVATAGALIGSKQIKNNSVTSADIKDHTIVGKDVKAKSLPGTVLKRDCKSTELKAFGSCVSKVPAGPVSYPTAVKGCSLKGGRIPSYAELGYLTTLPGLVWANAMLNQYEYTSDLNTSTSPPTSTARDFGGAFFGDASSQNFYHHCLTPA